MRRRAIEAVALAVVVLVGGSAWAFDAWVESFISADNRGRTPARPTVPASVDHALRVPVGPPDAELDVWVLDPSGAPRGTVLVLHGVHTGKAPMLGFGERLRESGLRAVLVDLRGHGGSSGSFLTYGVRDRGDLVRLLDALEARGLLASPVGIHGPSYGGAVALAVAATDARVDRFVTVSTFATAPDFAASYADALTGGLGRLLPEAVGEGIVREGGRRAGVDLRRADSVRAIQRTHAPGLLLHGDRDALIPYAHGRRLAAACGARCELVRLRGLDHRGALASPEAARRSLAFFSRDAAERVE